MTNRNHLATTAAFCAGIGWPTTYRRGALIVHGENPLLLVPSLALLDRQFATATMDAQAASIRLGWGGDVLLTGGHPLPAVRSYLCSDPPAGLLGELDAESGDYRWCPGLWLRCEVCDRLGVYAETGSWHARPCGHDRGPWHSRDANVSAIGRAWAEACFHHNTRRTR
jgi:hypothetical protein